MPVRRLEECQSDGILRSRRRPGQTWKGVIESDMSLLGLRKYLGMVVWELDVPARTASKASLNIYHDLMGSCYMSHKTEHVYFGTFMGSKQVLCIVHHQRL
ncbi:uncharacterized protein [Spinacia oleracea]|uniref:Uncharacterized protein n=1 Tax=Spinacia oleracea TaxID=3562 RepID=A0ABM3RR27_SPIOL|nr:uncharacterized protein LOC130471788 [Spinacia oleracea]